MYPGTGRRTGRAMVRRFGTAALVLGALTVPARATGADPVCTLPAFGPGSTYQPVIDRTTFTAEVDNPWFPLRVGTTTVFAGTKDHKEALDVVTATARTQAVDGVQARVVEDRLFLAGRLAERTRDYYAQDGCGNVWYFGEDTAELDRHGRVLDTAGSFHAGIDGAQPGVFMPAQPEVGPRFRQEWYEGQAEDTFEVVELSSAVSVPYGRFTGALRTEERTALEPGVLDSKSYVRGIGVVVERSVHGPREVLLLLDVIAGG